LSSFKGKENLDQAMDKAYLAILEIVQQNMQTLTLNTILFNNDTRASDHLARVPLAVDLAETSPSSKNLGVADLDQVDVVVGTQRLNELDVFRLGARIHEDAKMRLALV